MADPAVDVNEGKARPARRSTNGTDAGL